MTFWACQLVSFSTIFPSFISVVACVSILFLSLTEWYFMIGMYNILCIHSSVNKHLACFHLISIVNSAAVNTGKQISVQGCAFSSFEYIPSSGTVVLYTNLMFNFLRNRHTLFNHGYIILYFLLDHWFFSLTWELNEKFSWILTFCLDPWLQMFGGPLKHLTVVTSDSWSLGHILELFFFFLPNKGIV